MRGIFSSSIASIKISLLVAMRDKGALIFGVIYAALNCAFGVLLLFSVFSINPNVQGWTSADAYALYGWFLTMDGIAGALLVPALAKLPDQMRSGLFDSMILLPRGPRVHALLGQINPWRLPDVVIGVALILVSWSGNPPLHPLKALLAAALGMILLYYFWLLCYAITISYIRLDNASQLLQVPLSLARFPLPFYPSWLQWVLLSVVPVGVIVFIPISVLNGKSEFQFFGYSIVVTIVFAIGSEILYRRSLQRYVGI